MVLSLKIIFATLLLIILSIGDTKYKIFWRSVLKSALGLSVDWLLSLVKQGILASCAKPDVLLLEVKEALLISEKMGWCICGTVILFSLILSNLLYS